MTTLYGIKQCDTVRKARKWLDQHAIDYRFHDVREDGIDTATINDWAKQVDWQTLVNRRSTTWKQLDASERDALAADNFVALLVAHPTLIKRPVLTHNDSCTVGFKTDDYQNLFSQD